jgi:hypothetical protein
MLPQTTRRFKPKLDAAVAQTTNANPSAVVAATATKPSVAVRRFARKYAQSERDRSSL